MFRGPPPESQLTRIPLSTHLKDPLQGSVSPPHSKMPHLLAITLSLRTLLRLDTLSTDLINDRQAA